MFYYLNARFYDSDAGRFITMDDISYLGASNTVCSYNLFTYCENNPIMYVDESGNFSSKNTKDIVFACKSDSVYRKDGITIYDLNINNTNPNGNIIIEISDSTIQIKDSYIIRDDEEMKIILRYIMEFDSYKKYGYYRTIDSYLKEWKAHNFAYDIISFVNFSSNFDSIINRVRSVDFNKNIEDDEHRWAYVFF